MENFDNSSFESEGAPESPLFEEQTPQQPGNRNFMVALGVIGAVILVTILAVIIFLVFIQPNAARNRAAQATTIAEQNAATAVAATLASKAEQTAMVLTATFEALPPTPTLTSTATPVVVLENPTAVNMSFGLETPAGVTPTESGGAGGQGPESEALTATKAVMLTEQALTQTPLVVAGGLTGTPKPDGLPIGGFADEVGLPLLFGMGIFLLIVIFAARRLRMSAR